MIDLDDIWLVLRERFLGKTDKEILEGPLAHSVLGALPEHSSLSTHRIVDDATAKSGSFGFLWGIDKNKRNEDGRMGEPVVAILNRGENADGRTQYGAFGGYNVLETNDKVTRDETTQKGCWREISEELVNAEGQSIIISEPEKLNLLHAGIDYEAPDGYPVIYTGYEMKLSEQDLTKVADHAEKIASDASYRQKLIDVTEKEVHGVEVLPISRVLEMGKEAFAYPHEYEAFEFLSAKIEREQTRQSSAQR